MVEVGKKQDMNCKKNGYPKGSHIILQIACRNADGLETKILNRLRASIKERKDFGAEYFECTLDTIMGLVMELYRSTEDGILDY